MKKILMLTTGGTIASAPTAQGLAPRGASDMMAILRGITDNLDVTVREIMTLDSTNIQPEEWRTIASEIYDGFEGFDGIVVSHGTDTMAYTASMMSFMLQNPPIPVVFTGSQVSIFEPLTDAVFNLRCAFAMASTGIPGVFIAFDRKILLGCRAVKVRTSGFDAFESVNLPPVAVVDSRGLTINHAVIPRYGGAPALQTTLDSNVFLLKLTPATSPDIIDLLIKAGVRGIVIEAFGAGGLQFIRRNFPEKIESACAHGIPIIVCSQCLYEGSDFSKYQVGKMTLDSGAIQGFDMTTEAAVTKLMWTLGQGHDLSQIRRDFATSLSGEVDLALEMNKAK